MDALSPETLTLIDKYAAKIGIAADKVWAILVSQARIEGITDLFYIFLMIGIFFACKKAHSVIQKSADDPIPLCVVMWVVYGFAVLCVFLSVSDLITVFFNPDYWALHQLLKTVGK